MHSPSSRDDEPGAKRGEQSKGLSPEERVALDKLYSAAFQELKRVAIASKRSRNDPAVSTGTLINAAWIRLATSHQFAPKSREHFMNMAAEIMRQILVDAARRRGAVKRGKGIDFIDLDTSVLPEIETDRDILALDSALKELADVSPRQAQIVQERFFGGLQVSEIATRLGVTAETVRRDWRVAKAWLAAQLRPEPTKDRNP